MAGSIDSLQPNLADVAKITASFIFRDEWRVAMGV